MSSRKFDVAKDSCGESLLRRELAMIRVCCDKSLLRRKLPVARACLPKYVGKQRPRKVNNRTRKASRVTFQGSQHEKSRAPLDQVEPGAEHGAFIVMRETHWPPPQNSHKALDKIGRDSTAS